MTLFARQGFEPPVYVWVVSLMHANGRFEPKSAHFNEDEARWTVGSLAGTPGCAVSLARVKLIDYGHATSSMADSRVSSRLPSHEEVWGDR